MMENHQEIKVLVVGDDGIGKTCFVYRYSHQIFPDVYVPKVVECICPEVKYDGIPIKMIIWDMSARTKDFYRERPLHYPCTDAFLLCFSIASLKSFDNIKQIWIPELKANIPKVPVILVGLKLDLRNNEAKMKETDPDFRCVSYTEGLQLARGIKAFKYVECSSLANEGVVEAYQEAIHVAMKHKNKPACAIF